MCGFIKPEQAEHIPLKKYYKEFNHFKELSEETKVNDITSALELNLKSLAPKVVKKSLFGKIIYEDINDVTERIDQKSEEINSTVRYLFQQTKIAQQNELTAITQRGVIENWRQKELSVYKAEIGKAIEDNLLNRINKARAEDIRIIARFKEDLKNADARNSILRNQILEEQKEYQSSLTKSVAERLSVELAQARTEDKKLISQLKAALNNEILKNSKQHFLIQDEQNQYRALLKINKKLKEDSLIFKKEITDLKEQVRYAKILFSPEDVQKKLDLFVIKRKKAQRAAIIIEANLQELKTLKFELPKDKIELEKDNEMVDSPVLDSDDYDFCP